MPLLKELGICKSFHLPDHCSVFQAELVAITEAVNCFRSLVLSDNLIHIFSDSHQAALRALASITVKSKTVENFRKSLTRNVMAEQFSLNLVWVPVHSNMPGNEMADELARKGTALSLSSSWKSAGMPHSTCKLNIRELFINDAIIRLRSLNISHSRKSRDLIEFEKEGYIHSYRTSYRTYLIG